MWWQQAVSRPELLLLWCRGRGNFVFHKLKQQCSLWGSSILIDEIKKCFSCIDLRYLLNMRMWVRGRLWGNNKEWGASRPFPDCWVAKGWLQKRLYVYWIKREPKFVSVLGTEAVTDQSSVLGLLWRFRTAFPEWVQCTQRTWAKAWSWLWVCWLHKYLEQFLRV